MSIIGLPLGWRSFLAHPCIMKSSFPFRTRWRHDLDNFFKYFPAHPPPLHSAYLLHEPLAFNTWILKGKLLPLGLRAQVAVLFSSPQVGWLSLIDVVAPSLPSTWRFLSREELCSKFSQFGASVLHKIISKIPISSGSPALLLSPCHL